MYVDNRIFVRDYLSAFTITNFVHPEIEEKIFFLQSLKKVVLHFENELCIPTCIIKTIDLFVTDLLFISKDLPFPQEEQTSKVLGRYNSHSEYIDSLKNKKREETISSPITDIARSLKKIELARKTIDGHFDALSSDKSWEYAFRKKEDKEIIVGLLVPFSTGGRPIEIPNEKIQLKLKSKTKVAMAIKSMYQDLGKGEVKK